VAPLRIHQEFAAIGRDGGAEVVRDSLVHAEPGDDAERRREIDAELPVSSGTAAKWFICRSQESEGVSSEGVSSEGVSNDAGETYGFPLVGKIGKSWLLITAKL